MNAKFKQFLLIFFIVFHNKFVFSMLQDGKQGKCNKIETLLSFCNRVLAKEKLGTFEFKNFLADFEKYIEESVFYYDKKLLIIGNKLIKIKLYITLLEENLTDANFVAQLKEKILLILAKQILNEDKSDNLSKIIEAFVIVNVCSSKIVKLKHYKQLINDFFGTYVNVNNLINDIINKEYSFFCTSYLSDKVSLEYWTPLLCAIRLNFKAAKTILEIVDYKTRQEILKAKTKDNKTCLMVLMVTPVSAVLRLLLEAADEETRKFIIRSKDKSKNILMLAVEQPNHLELLQVIFEFTDEHTKNALLSEKDDENRTSYDIFREIIGSSFEYSARASVKETLKMLQRK